MLLLELVHLLKQQFMCEGIIGLGGATGVRRGARLLMARRPRNVGAYSSDARVASDNYDDGAVKAKKKKRTAEIE